MLILRTLWKYADFSKSRKVIRFLNSQGCSKSFAPRVPTSKKKLVYRSSEESVNVFGVKNEFFWKALRKYDSSSKSKY